MPTTEAPVLDVLVIGQAPRPDVEAENRAAVPGLGIRMQGALDGIPREGLTALAPPAAAA